MDAAKWGEDRRKDAEQLLESMAQAEKARRAQGRATKLEAAMEDADRIALDEEYRAMLKARNQALTIIKKREILDFISKYEGTPGQALYALMGGTVDAKPGSRRSIDLNQKTISAFHAARMYTRLQESKVFDKWSQRDMQVPIAIELEILNGKVRAGSGNADAVKIAKILNDEMSAVLNRKNLAGASIHEIIAFIANQTHDMGRIRRAAWDPKWNQPSTWKFPSYEDSFKKWKEDFLPLLDKQRTFGDMTPAQIEAKLKDSFGAFITGEHYKLPDGQRALKDRTYHFKDAESFIAYNDKYGMKSLTETIESSLKRAGQDIGLMEGFGPVPIQTFKEVRDHLRDLHAGDVKAIESINSKQLDNLYANIDGSTRIPANHFWAQVGQTIRIDQMLSKLGGSMPHSITDLATAAAELRRNGVHVMGSYTDMLQAAMKKVEGGDPARVARAFAVGLEGMRAASVSRLSSDDFVSGFLKKVQNAFFSWNFQRRWDDFIQRGFASVLSNQLAEHAHLNMGELKTESPDLHKMFDLYGITSSHWDHFRRGVWADPNGFKFLTPDRIREFLPESEVKAHILAQNDGKAASAANVERYYNELETKWTGYMQDRVNFAVPKPDASEMAYLNFGTKPGTPEGEAIRFIAQFKGFPLSVARKGLYFDGKLNAAKGIPAKDQLASMAHLFAAQTVLGYLGYAATDIAQGKEPRDPTSVKTLIDSMIKGGGAGFYGDYLFGEFNKTGRGALASIAGPTFGQMDSVFDILTRARHTITGQDNADFASQLMNLGLQNTPFANLFYARLAANYLFLWSLKEHMNPGSLKRSEALLMHDNEQKYFENVPLIGDMTPSALVEKSPTNFINQ